MPSFKIILAYDGTDFVGWQRQAAGVSIQGLLEDALRDLEQRAVTVTGAGRTDAGVHALGQVAAFSIQRALSADAVTRALNARLPPAVRVLSADEVPPSFHPRFDARAKSYRYRIWNGEIRNPFERRYAWHLPGAIDLGAMQTAARILEGAHDFSAFQATGSVIQTTAREILSSRFSKSVATVDPEDNEAASVGGTLMVYEVTGTGFLRHMVRTIVGSLVEVGRGRHAAAWLADVLTSRDRGLAGPTAPAEGLFLVSVTYGVVESGFPAKEP